MFERNLLHGKKILVTGGGSGLGRAFAEAYVALGADCHICGRREDVVQQAAADIEQKYPEGGRIYPYACNIKDSAQVEQMVDKIWSRAPLTGLVNNAAGNFISPTQDLSPRGFCAITDIVFHGTFNVTQAIGKRWIKDGSFDVTKSVISILVTWIRNGSPFTVPSAMSKSGIHAMTKSLAVEWARYGIRLNAIEPGLFPTEGARARLHPGASSEDFAKELKTIPMRRYGDKPELANLAVFLMADGCDYLTGESIAVDGGRFLATGANFYNLADLGATDWEEKRNLIKAEQDKDKLRR